MWKRKELKMNARRSIRQNYWRMVSVCFLIALLTASYPLATAFLGVHPLSHIDTISNLHQTFETETTSQILEETATRLFHNTDIENLYQNPFCYLYQSSCGSVCRQYLYLFLQS